MGAKEFYIYHATLSVENVIAVEDDIFPRDRADIAEEREVYMFRRCVGLNNTVNFLGLPVYNTGNHKCQAVTGILLL